MMTLKSKKAQAQVENIDFYDWALLAQKLQQYLGGDFKKVTAGASGGSGALTVNQVNFSSDLKPEDAAKILKMFADAKQLDAKNPDGRLD